MPKSLLPLLLVLLLCFSSVPFAFAQDGFTTLTNADILTMVRAKLPPALIIEKINTSSCKKSEIPPTAVGGCVQTHATKANGNCGSNPTNRSWWIRSYPTFEQELEIISEVHADCSFS
ncbi:MAG TPA: hypothetical protein VJ372_04810 [Pyrinomonadaceae bacterium]|nr:hypothetical protein [Pyrinomonadaceae bacterium]